MPKRRAHPRAAARPPKNRSATGQETIAGTPCPYNSNKISIGARINVTQCRAPHLSRRRRGRKWNHRLQRAATVASSRGLEALQATDSGPPGDYGAAHLGIARAGAPRTREHRSDRKAGIRGARRGGGHLAGGGTRPVHRRTCGLRDRRYAAVRDRAAARRWPGNDGDPQGLPGGHLVSALRPFALARGTAGGAYRSRWHEVRLRAVRARLALRLEYANLRQRKAVEVARIGGRVRACVLDVHEIAFLQVRRQRLVAHDDGHRVAGRPADGPGNVGAGALGADAVLQALAALDHAAEQACVPVHPALAGAGGCAEHAADEIAGVGDQEAAWLGDHLHVLGEGPEALLYDLADDLDRRDRLDVPDRKAAADIEQARLQARLAHDLEERSRLFQGDAPVLRVAALRTDVERYTGQVRAELGGQGDDLARVGGAGSEFAGQRPVAADVGSGDPQVLLGIRLGLVDAPQLVGAVDDEPFHAPGGGVGDRLARLHGVGKEDLARRHAETQEKLELGRRRDLKARALLHQHLEHPAVRIGLDRVMRPHAGHGGAKAPHLAAHDGGVDDQERSAVPLLCGLADDLEVEADLGMRVEELFLLRLPGKGVLSAACKATWAIPHQSSPEMDLGLRNIADANFIDRAAVPFACHDDLLLLAEVEGKTPADYRDDPSGVKGLAKIFSFFLRGAEAQPGRCVPARGSGPQRDNH